MLPHKLNIIQASTVKFLNFLGGDKMGKGGKGKRRRRNVDEEESKRKSGGQRLSREDIFEQNKICWQNC